MTRKMQQVDTLFGEYADTPLFGDWTPDTCPIPQGQPADLFEAICEAERRVNHGRTFGQFIEIVGQQASK